MTYNQIKEIQNQICKTSQFKQLSAMLLKEGGNNVIPMPDPHIEQLLNNAYVLPGNKSNLVRGLPSHCHENAAVLWIVNSTQLVIGTGYALTADDKTWRQHSWLLDLSNNKIIETTSKRDLYCGIYLDYDEALLFTAQNCHNNSWINYDYLLTSKQIAFFKGIPKPKYI